MENSIDRKPLGVIEALSSGFELVLRQPWVLFVPLLLDLFLWQGPQIHAKPVFDQMMSLFSAAALPGTPADAQQTIDSAKQALQAAGDQFNVFSFIALFAMGMPTLMGADLPTADTTPGFTLFSVKDVTTLLGWAVGLALVGILVGSIYLEAIARIVRHDIRLKTILPRLVRSFLNVLGLLLVAAIGGTILLLPFLLSAFFISFFSQGLGSFFILAGWLVILWAGLYLAFAVPSIFVSGANFPQAIMNSVSVFRYNFWSAMGLIFLIIVIQTGFSIIWQELLNSSAGIIVGMIANAILGSALVAAGMLFYHDRFTWLTQVRQRIRQQQRPLLKG